MSFLKGTLDPRQIVNNAGPFLTQFVDRLRTKLAESCRVTRIGRQVGGVLVASNCNFTGGGGQLGVKGQAGQYEHWQGQHPGTQGFHGF